MGFTSPRITLSSCRDSGMCCVPQALVAVGSHLAFLCGIRPGDAAPATRIICLLCALWRQPGTQGGSVPNSGRQARQACDQR